jgi:hypothetical protein
VSSNCAEIKTEIFTHAESVLLDMRQLAMLQPIVFIGKFKMKFACGRDIRIIRAKRLL